MPLPDPLQRAGVRIDMAQALGELMAAEDRVDPFGEVPSPASESVARLDDVEEEGAGIDPGEGVPELPECPRLVAGGDGHEMIL